ncbi:hypothetical protein BGZ72_003175 [Mortierella alpina]|nr:hypothetical protein BGZ72_003175 [Mortierella alpina]
MVSPTDTPTEPLTPPIGAGVGKAEQVPHAPPKGLRNATSLSFLQKSATSEATSGPELSPPLSPTLGSSLKDLGNWKSKSKQQSPSHASNGGSNDATLQPARKSFQIAERARKFGIGAPIANEEAARKMSPMIIEQQQEALRKMSASPPPNSPHLSGRVLDAAQHVETHQPHPMATFSVPGTRPTLPAELQSSISQFRIAGFAQKYFSTHKKGLFRRKVPMEKMLLHQKSPLSQPLMVLNKRGVQKDALRCFKIIQKLMGERKGNGYVGPTGVELGETCVDLSIRSEEDIRLVLELIKKGLDHGELRDEIYVQLCKQLTENPSREGSIKGWHLFTILLITFSPSKNLHDYLASFLNQHATTSLHPVPVMAQHCHDLLRRISKRGSRAKQLTLVEIARAQEAAFRPSVFEATLERLMGRQMAAGGEWAAWRVPRLMVFLKESVINLGGLKTEGIFRISGDLGAVSELTFLEPSVKEATKMSLSNLAMVFAPTLLQCSTDDAPMLMGHLQAERSFVATLISEVELGDEDLQIVGEASGSN